MEHFVSTLPSLPLAIPCPFLLLPKTSCVALSLPRGCPFKTPVLGISTLFTRALLRTLVKPRLAYLLSGHNIVITVKYFPMSQVWWVHARFCQPRHIHRGGIQFLNNFIISTKIHNSPNYHIYPRTWRKFRLDLTSATQSHLRITAS